MNEDSETTSGSFRIASASACCSVAILSNEIACARLRHRPG